VFHILIPRGLREYVKKTGKEIQHLVSSFLSFCFFDRGKRHSNPYVQCSRFPGLLCSLPVFLCSCSHHSSLHYSLSRAVSRSYKDHPGDISDALLRCRHRSCRVSRRTLTTGGFKEINFLAACLSHLHFFYSLYLV
jgi:hypothetical protein